MKRLMGRNATAANWFRRWSRRAIGIEHDLTEEKIAEQSTSSSTTCASNPELKLWF